MVLLETCTMDYLEKFQLFKLHHISPVGSQSTTYTSYVHHFTEPCSRQPFLTSNILYSSLLPINWNFYQNYMILTVEWSQNTISICICSVALTALGGWNTSVVAVQKNYFLKTEVHLLVFLVSFIHVFKNLYVWYFSGTQLDQLLHPSQVVLCLCGLRIR